MLIAVAYSLRYERLKNLEFSIKNTCLYEEVVEAQHIGESPINHYNRHCLIII